MKREIEMNETEIKIVSIFKQLKEKNDELDCIKLPKDTTKVFREFDHERGSQFEVYEFRNGIYVVIDNCVDKPLASFSNEFQAKVLEEIKKKR